MRLTEKGHQWGAVSEHRFDHFNRTLSAYNEALNLLNSVRHPVSFWQKYISRVKGSQAGKG